MNYSNLSSYQNSGGKIRDGLVPRVLPRLDKIDWRQFRNKTVLDIGCNNGEFTRAAIIRGGAKKSVGVDISDCIIGARELAKEENVRAQFWQVDVESKEFRLFCSRFDIVFLLSSLAKIKDKDRFLDWLDLHTKGILYFESNHGEIHKKDLDLVKKHFYFRKIKEIGMTDVPEKPHYMWCCFKAPHESRYPGLEKIEVIWIPIDNIQNELWTWENVKDQNRYEHTPKSIAALREDIWERGIREPLLVNALKDGIFKGRQGAHRYLIAKELGYKELPCKVMF